MSQPLRTFWYVSPQKLGALSVGRRRWFSRLTSFKFGFFPVSVEVGVQPGADDPKLQAAVNRTEERLRKTETVISIRNMSGGGAVKYFDYQGPSARVVVGGVFYMAAICDTSDLPPLDELERRRQSRGVLLVGSAANAIGAPTANTSYLSASADPIGAIKAVFANHGQKEAVKELEEARHVHDAERRLGLEEAAELGPPSARSIPAWIARAHASILSESGVTLDSLPLTRGIALYAGRQDVPRPKERYTGVSSVVVGSPLWVEQISF